MDPTWLSGAHLVDRCLASLQVRFLEDNGLPYKMIDDKEFQNVKGQLCAVYLSQFGKKEEAEAIRSGRKRAFFKVIGSNRLQWVQNVPQHSVVGSFPEWDEQDASQAIRGDWLLHSAAVILPGRFKTHIRSWNLIWQLKVSKTSKRALWLKTEIFEEIRELEIWSCVPCMGVSLSQGAQSSTCFCSKEWDGIHFDFRMCWLLDQTMQVSNGLTPSTRGH